MTTNKYFSDKFAIGRESEKLLKHDLVIEMIKLSGHDVCYIPRTLNSLDHVLNEDPLASFEKFFQVEMYLGNIDTWGASNDMMTKFGLTVDTQAEWWVSTKRFTEETGFPNPKEGDLIYFPLSRSLFEIDHVDFEKSFYQLGGLYLYYMKCSLFTYSYETFKTGIPQIDTDLNPDTFYEAFDKSADITEFVQDRKVIDFTEENPFGEVEEKP